MDTKVVLFYFFFFSCIAKTTRSLILSFVRVPTNEILTRSSSLVGYPSLLSLLACSSRDPISYLFYYFLFRSLFLSFCFFLRFLFFLARITRLSHGCIQNIVIGALSRAHRQSRARVLLVSFCVFPFYILSFISSPVEGGKDGDEREEENASASPLRLILTEFRLTIYNRSASRLVYHVI